MLDHLSIQCADLAKSAAFYDAVLAPLGGRRLIEFGPVIGYGVDRPSFWIGQQSTGDGFRESHIAFAATDRQSVDAFFASATAAGAEVLHEPRVWPEYHPGYYGGLRTRPRRQQRRGGLPPIALNSPLRPGSASTSAPSTPDLP